MVIIDCPDFTHRVARRVRKKNRTIPIVDYVSPSVWAWRPGRARAMRRYIDHVLALLPFEPDVHRKLGGPPCTYVGHPLVEQIGELRPNAEEAARRQQGTPILLVLPGSRKNEIRRLIEPFGRSGRADGKDGVAARYRDPDHAASAGHGPARDRALAAASENRGEARGPARGVSQCARGARQVRHRDAGTRRCPGVPMVTAYKVSGLEAVIARRLIRVPSVILANLVLGENVVPEFIQTDCTPERLSAALAPLFSDTPERRAQVEAFARLDELMEIGKAEPAKRAAEIVEDVAKRGKS